MSKEIEKIVSSGIEPLTQLKQGLTVGDKESLESDLGRTISEEVAVASDEAETSTLTERVSPADTYRYGHFASSHILDYSKFNMKSTTEGRTSLAPQYPFISGPFEQISRTTTIAATHVEASFQQIPSLTVGHQRISPTLTEYQKSRPEPTATQQSFGPLSTTPSQGTVGFPSTNSQISESSESQTAVTSAETESSVSENILPFEPLVTSSTNRPVLTTAQLIVFTNKTLRSGTTTEASSRQSESEKFLDDAGKLTVEKVTLTTSHNDLIKEKNALVATDLPILSKVKSEDRVFHLEHKNQGNRIPVGDREILDEQMQLEASHTPASRVVVGEQDSEVRETHPHYSSIEQESSIASNGKALYSRIYGQQGTTTESEKPNIDTEVSDLKPDTKALLQTTSETPRGSSFSPKERAFFTSAFDGNLRGGEEETGTFEVTETTPENKAFLNSLEDQRTLTSTAITSQKHFMTSLSDYSRLSDSSTIAAPRAGYQLTDSGQQLMGSVTDESVTTEYTQPSNATDIIAMKVSPSLNLSSFNKPNISTSRYGASLESGSALSQSVPSKMTQIVSSPSQLITNQVEIGEAAITEVSKNSGSIQIGDKSEMKSDLEMRGEIMDEGYQNMNTFTTGDFITSASSDRHIALEAIGSQLSSELGKELNREISEETATLLSSAQATFIFFCFRY